MNLEFFVSRKYFFSLKNNKVVNILSGISVLGIIVSTMAMFIVLSVFSGLEKSTEKLLSTFNPSIKITPQKGKFFDYDENIINDIKLFDNVFSVSKTIEDKVLIKYQKKELIAYIKGFDQEFLKKEAIKNSIRFGEWFEFNHKYNNFMTIGTSIAFSLGIPRSESVFPLEVFYPNKDYQTDERDNIFFSEKYQKKGIFDIERDVNSKYIFTTLENVQRLFNIQKISSIEIQITDNTTQNDILILKNKLHNLLGSNFDIKTLREQNEFYYKMVNTEKLASFGILLLIMIISIFNMIGSVVMLILDKKNDIKTLINLGLTTKKIQNIFVYQGFLINFSGCFIGIFLSSSIVLLQSHYGFIKMSFTNVPYPLLFSFKNLYITIITMVLLGILSSLISIRYILKKKIIKNF